MAKREIYKVGDVVRLKSGGPNMTIQRVGMVSDARGTIAKRPGAVVTWEYLGSIRSTVVYWDMLERAA